MRSSSPTRFRLLRFLGAAAFAFFRRGPGLTVARFARFFFFVFGIYAFDRFDSVRSRFSRSLLTFDPTCFSVIP